MSGSPKRADDRTRPCIAQARTNEEEGQVLRLAFAGQHLEATPAIDLDGADMLTKVHGQGTRRDSAHDHGLHLVTLSVKVTPTSFEC